jgi:hypothetical protein
MNHAERGGSNHSGRFELAQLSWRLWIHCKQTLWTMMERVAVR